MRLSTSITIIKSNSSHFISLNTEISGNTNYSSALGFAVILSCLQEEGLQWPAGGCSRAFLDWPVSIIVLYTIQSAKIRARQAFHETGTRALLLAVVDCRLSPSESTGAAAAG